MVTFRAAALAPLLLALAVAGVEAANSLSLGANPDFWLRAYDGDRDSRRMSEMLQLVADANGCSSTGVSGRALTAATADLMRQAESSARFPLAVATAVYGRLSGCTEALQRGLSQK